MRPTETNLQQSFAWMNTCIVHFWSPSASMLATFGKLHAKEKLVKAIWFFATFAFTLQLRQRKWVMTDFVTSNKRLSKDEQLLFQFFAENEKAVPVFLNCMFALGNPCVRSPTKAACVRHCSSCSRYEAAQGKQMWRTADSKPEKVNSSIFTSLGTQTFILLTSSFTLLWSEGGARLKTRRKCLYLCPVRGRLLNKKHT